MSKSIPLFLLLYGLIHMLGWLIFVSARCPDVYLTNVVDIIYDNYKHNRLEPNKEQPRQWFIWTNSFSNCDIVNLSSHQRFGTKGIQIQWWYVFHRTKHNSWIENHFREDIRDWLLTALCAAAGVMIHTRVVEYSCQMSHVPYHFQIIFLDVTVILF